MKKITLACTLLLGCFNPASAQQDKVQLSVYDENMDNGNAASISLRFGEEIYGGISANYIRSKQVIQVNDRKTIYPVFAFIGMQLPARVSPYIEGGVDLPEAIFDEIFDDEDNAIDLTDYYLAAGLNIGITERLSLAVYARKYVFKYQGITLNTTNKVRDDSYGAGLIVHF